MNHIHELIIRFTVGPLLMVLGVIQFMNSGLSFDSWNCIPTIFCAFMGSMIFFWGLPVPHEWFEDKEELLR